MKLIFFRHADSAKKKKDNDELDDFRRPLTKRGVSDAKLVSRRCRSILKDVNVIFSSPLVRALHTAVILHREIPKSSLEIMPSLDKLLPPDTFLSEIESFKPNKSYCFVGHEPHLTQTINALLGPQENDYFDLLKGGMIILEGENLNSLRVAAMMSPNVISKIKIKK